AIVELDALPNAIGTTTQNDHLLRRTDLAFALAFVARVQVRCMSRKLRGAGVDPTEDCANAELMAELAHSIFCQAFQLGDVRIAEAQTLALVQQLPRQRGALDAPLVLDDARKLADEPRIDLGQLMHLAFRDACA